MLYNIYTTEGNAPLGITDWEHLRVMRLDFTERQLYNHRYVKTDKKIKHLYKERKPGSTLKKLGFIARDFHECRPSGQLSIRFFTILAQYKNQFELYFYSKQGDPISNVFKKLGKIKMENNYDELARTVANDDIDILVDMQGFMVNNFTNLLLQKPAPIQMHWLGYPGTLGLSTIDYLVADDILIPSKSQKYYREKIAYLPHLYQSNNPEFIQTEQYVKRGFFKLPEDKFIFTHFNSDYKLDRKTWFEWMDILKQTKDSILVFTVLTSGTNDLFIKQLICDSILKGVENGRVIYLPKADRHQHFNRLQLFNLGLDTFRVNGHTTNADLVCAGVPFITCTSETYHNRVAKSILHELDLPDLVCTTFDQYKKKAIELASNPDYYASVKAKVIENRNKVMFNTHLYTRSFVNLIYSIWDSYHGEGKRETVEHYFLNEETKKTETRVVPFEKARLTKFNHHYYGTPTHKWVFYENKRCNAPSYCVSDKRNQYLRDFANEDETCMVFTTDGQLKHRLGKLLDEEGVGTWVREELEEDEHELPVSETLNKDYQLPKICLYFKFAKGMDQNMVSNVVSYLYNQSYLNAELIIISYNGDLPMDGKKFIIDHCNFVKFIVNHKNEPVETILKENISTKIKIELQAKDLNNMFFLEEKSKTLV